MEYILMDHQQYLSTPITNIWTLSKIHIWNYYLLSSQLNLAGQNFSQFQFSVRDFSNESQGSETS